MSFFKFHHNKNRFPAQDSWGKKGVLINPCVPFLLCFRPKGILTSGMILLYLICKSRVNSQVSVESYQLYLQEGPVPFSHCLPSYSTAGHVPGLGFSSPFLWQFPLREELNLSQIPAMAAKASPGHFIRRPRVQEKQRLGWTMPKQESSWQRSGKDKQVLTWGSDAKFIL